MGFYHMPTLGVSIRKSALGACQKWTKNHWFFDRFYVQVSFINLVLLLLYTVIMATTVESDINIPGRRTVKRIVGYTKVVTPTKVCMNRCHD